MSFSVTIHQNMGNAQPWDNPNVWVGDAQGNPVTPVKGQECHLWAQVMNNGTETASIVVVSFYLCIPNGLVVWPDSAHGSNSSPSLAVNAQARIMCTVPWIPDTSVSTHQCLVAVVSCEDCPAPPTTPGAYVDLNNSQIGQRNLTINNQRAAAKAAVPTVAAEAAAEPEPAFDRTFHIQARADGYVEVVRAPLEANSTVLESLGLDPNLAEAPQADAVNILADGKAIGTTFQFRNGDQQALAMRVEGSGEPNTAAFYHVKYYEGSQLVGGVSHLVLY